MNDPGTFQIPPEFQTRPELEADQTNAADTQAFELNLHDEHIQTEIKQGLEEAEDFANTYQPANGEQSYSPEASRLIKQIGYLGDWVVHERTQRLQAMQADKKNVWSKLLGVSGEATATRNMMAREAKLSSKIFEDKSSVIFFFDKFGEGHGEWVLHKASEMPDGETVTVYYEIVAGDDVQQPHVVVKWPGFAYRYATDSEIEQLHKTTSRYYKLVKTELYS